VSNLQGSAMQDRRTKYWTEKEGVLTEHTANLSFAIFGAATLEGQSTSELGGGTVWGVFTV
jgi:hypothetical protein